MKNGLIHIKYDRETHELVYDIFKHNIYYDSTEGNYRRKLKCDCGKIIGCFCFCSLDAAMETTRFTYAVCNRCYLEENAEELDEVMGNDHKPLSRMTDDEVNEVITTMSEDAYFDSDMDMAMCGL